MQVCFNSPIQVHKSAVSRRKFFNNKPQSAKQFSYSKRNLTTLNFQQMYKSLQQNVTNLVYQNRLKLTAMNLNSSQALINKTQNKLLKYMKISRQKERICYMLQNNKNTYKGNIQPAKDFNFQTQQIFDFGKMEQIIQKKNRNKNSQCKENQRFSGVLCDKLIKLSHHHKITNTPIITANNSKINTLLLNNVQIGKIPIITTQLNDQHKSDHKSEYDNLAMNGNSTSRDYKSWKSQKIKRKKKNILC